MKANLRDRLRRMGVHKGMGQLKLPPAQRSRFREEDRTPAISNLQSPISISQSPISNLAQYSGHQSPDAPLWNLEKQTALGPAFIRQTRYPINHQHGNHSLASALDLDATVLSRLSHVTPTDLRNVVFLDTETTGLSGGTGTLVFLVGVGYFDVHDAQQQAADFIVDQYFLRDPNEEAGMLAALDASLNQRNGVVTFNGRGFDVPLLETRYTLARIAPVLSDLPNLDLLMPARRAWRMQIGSCSLSALEFHMLHVQRNQQDIPGFLIPDLYRAYLASHESADMQRVMYHNLLDILSMVTLVTRLGNAVSAPSASSEHLAAGQYYENGAQLREAEAAYAAALRDADANQQTDAMRRALRLLAACLKRQERRAEAVPHWQRLGDAGDLEAWLELAKYYEWQLNDVQQALNCARQALALSRDPYTRNDITHRVARLRRKLTGDERRRDGAAPPE